jgi:uncharacterized protein involved in exopolysaccharide biosynthesis
MEEGSEAGRAGLREYAHMLWGRRLVIVLTMVACVGLALAYSVVSSKKYTATAHVLIEPAISSTLLQAQFPTGAGLITDVPDAIEVLQGPQVAAAVVQHLPDAVGASVSEISTTDVVSISSTSKNPQLAAASANAYANAFIHYQRQKTIGTFVAAQQQLNTRISGLQLQINNLNQLIKAAPPTADVRPEEAEASILEGQLTKLQNQLENYQFFESQGVTTEGGQVITPAVVPTSASSPKPVKYVLIALIIGLILGVGLAFLLNALSPRR